jgi:hypothetical protein
MSNINERPHPGDLLTLAFELINARGSEYDNVSGIEQNFREIAAVASVLIGKSLTARDVAMVMATVKLVRSKSAPDKIDNYVDGMNYMAFAACFQGLVPLPPLGAKAPVKEVVQFKDVKEANL